MQHSLLTMKRATHVDLKPVGPAGDFAAPPKLEPVVGSNGKPIDLDILPSLLGFNLRRAQIELWRDFAATVGAGETRPGLFSMMLLIGANPGIAQIDLATQLGVDKASIVALVDRLESEGWVQRRRSAEDRRRQEIFMTPAGAKKLAQLKREALEHDARFRAAFTVEEQRQLLDFLARIRR